MRGLHLEHTQSVDDVPSELSRCAEDRSRVSCAAVSEIHCLTNIERCHDIVPPSDDLYKPLSADDLGRGKKGLGWATFHPELERQASPCV